MKLSAQKSMHAWGARVSVSAALGILFLLSALVSPAAAAHNVASNWFYGSAIIPAGQTSPVQVDPHNIVIRASDHAVGIGYAYRAAGQAFGQLPGSFTYEEHGYIYFRNPADPTSMVGSKFVSGVFTLLPRNGKGEGLRTPIQIADTAPDLYTSGIKTETYTSGIQSAIEKLGGRAHSDLSSLLGPSGSISYGYFTFTNNHGTFTGYATPDFTRFIIPITFDY